jgi:hypothetical protein
MEYFEIKVCKKKSLYVLFYCIFNFVNFCASTAVLKINACYVLRIK